MDADARPELWVAGDGPETDALRRRYPPSDDVAWLGVVDEEEKVGRLLAADVVCAPSLGGESFGLVLLEGMAAGTVVVASDIDGYREAAGGRAVLADPGDPAALAAALAEAVAPDGPLRGVARSTWLAEARERARSWSMEALAGRYEELYRDVLSPGGSTPAVH
jgi:phosphatidylinositol alpha-mannosyltransferase